MTVCKEYYVLFVSVTDPSGEVVNTSTALWTGISWGHVVVVVLMLQVFKLLSFYFVE